MDVILIFFKMNCKPFRILTCSSVSKLLNEENVAKINETAASLPVTEGEIELANLTLVQSEYVTVPGVMEAKVRMECRLVQAIPLGVEEPGSDLFIGEVVRFHIDEAITFYEDTLNFELRMTGNSGTRKIAFIYVKGNPGLEIKLIEELTEVAKPELKGIFDHLAFTVDNLNETIKELKSKGVQFLSEEPRATATNRWQNDFL
jgi:uncharacterized glyoxalase superfamily protein PhnB